MAGLESSRNAPPEGRGARLPGWITETPYWAVSAVGHVILMLVIGSVVLLRESDEKGEVETIVRLDSKRTPYDPTRPRKLNRFPLSDAPPTPTPDPRPEVTPPDVPRDNPADRADEFVALPDPFGVAGAGTPHPRSAPGRGSGEGITAASESAVLAALHWLQRHQHADGHWSGARYTHECADSSQPCAMAEEGYTDGSGTDGHDVGLTGLAMLAFLGYAHTHRDGEHKEFRLVMKRAMEWMLRQQVTNANADDPTQVGRFGPTTVDEWMYGHAIATMAMGELLFLSQDRIKLQRSVEAAANFCMASQNEGYGWKYEYRDGLNDTSVTGWMVLALKTAKSCSSVRLIKTDKQEFQRHIDWALAWFDRSTAKVSGRTGYESPGDAGSRILVGYPEPYPFSKDPASMTAVAVLCRMFAGQSRRTPEVEKGIAILQKEPPTWAGQRGKRLSKINMYYWYYATYAMFQYGGSAWKGWNTQMQAALIPHQRQLGCEDGSWDPVGEWGLVGGRVYATAISAMTLEVYYRFERSND